VVRGKIKNIIFFIYLLAVPFNIFAEAPAASRTVDGVVYYYNTLHEALADSTTGSYENPDEIILLTDVVLDEPLIIADGVHIQLVPDGDRTIQRSIHNIEYPVIWVDGDTASLSLGKPDMVFELIIDGGHLNTPPIQAHAPLVMISGPDSKLIMCDNVIIQNNNNIAATSFRYQAGSGVYIFTDENLFNRPSEFIMKGGIIRGNIVSSRNNPLGGGVRIFGFGIFTMEGGVIMNNIARSAGGGVYVYGGTLIKTGGIIYGSDAPEGYRNISMGELGHSAYYAHAVLIVNLSYLALRYRNDTVGENDNLTYFGSPTGPGTFGRGERWSKPDRGLRRWIIISIIAALAIAIPIVIYIWRKTGKIIAAANIEASELRAIIKPGAKLSPRENEIFYLLLTALSVNQIANTLKITYSGANYHIQNLYNKLGIQSRTELLVKYRKKLYSVN
jgi:DNA-binding CsgD family transcriptional regulator